MVEMHEAKTTRAGVQARLELLSHHLPQASSLLARVLAETPRARVKADDVHDALAGYLTTRPTPRRYAPCVASRATTRKVCPWRCSASHGAGRGRHSLAAQVLGSSPNLVGLVDRADRPCAEARAIASAHLTQVIRKLDQLKALNFRLNALMCICDSTCAGGPAMNCRILLDLALLPAAVRLAVQPTRCR